MRSSAEPVQQELRSGIWWRNLVAGGLAGAVSRTMTAPLDRLKVYLQVHGGKDSNIKTILSQMIQEGGVKSLWRGNGVNVLKIAPESALKFMAYDQAKQIITDTSTSREVTIYQRFAAGSLAGAFSQSAIYPLEVLKTRLALRQTGQYSSILDAAKKIYCKEGLKSFYRGYLPNLIGIIPFAGIDLAVYETVKNYYMRQQPDGEGPSVRLLIACGTVSCTCGQLFSYPLCLVKTKLQAELKPDTMTSLFRNILKSEGVMGLYRGISLNLIKVIPAVSISYVVYERCRQALGAGRMT